MEPLITYDNGIAIAGLEFVLDAGRACEFGFVSHAHTDHARKHDRIIATPETVLFYRQRFPQVPTRAIPFGRRIKFGEATVELFPSGHMLGAAQILVEIQRTRIVYTGDFKVYPNFTCPPLETRRCDILIMESTYGDPAYSFPPQNEVYAKIVGFVKRTLADKNTPVLMGYAMGKTQEAVSLLQQHGFEVCVDTHVAKVNQLYRTAGIKLEPTEHYLHTALENKVVVVSPQSLRNREYHEIKRKKSLFLSGWAVGSKNRNHFGADAGVPLSDHADFTQLLSYIQACSPSKIYTLHGEPAFAQRLRDLGYDAHYLGKGFRSDTAPAEKEILFDPVSLPDNSAGSVDDIAIGCNFELF